jgi:hypothetical protein
MLAKINNGKIKCLLVIVVNTKAQNKATIDKNEAHSGLMIASYKTATVSIDNSAFKSVEWCT